MTGLVDDAMGAITFPFLEGSSAEEHSEVQVFRVSPSDSQLLSDPEKLAGISFGARGGFLSQDWREHDILWGRLDGAERIVTALMPNPEQADLRKEYIDRIQDAIIAQEFVEVGRSRREAMLKRLLGGGRWRGRNSTGLSQQSRPSPTARFDDFYGKPLSPETKHFARWGGRAAAILAQMLDDLPGNGALGALAPHLARPVRTGSVLTARLTVFALPGGYRRMFAEWVLFLVLLAGALLVGVAWFVQEPAVVRFGFVIVGLAITLWVLLYVIGRVLRDQTPLPTAARVLLVVACLLLIAVGAWTTYDFGARLVGLSREDVASSG